MQNRILNLADQLPVFADPMPNPQVPDSTATGQAIDAAVATPPPQMAPPAGAEETVAAASLDDVSPADALQVEGVLQDL